LTREVHIAREAPFHGPYSKTNQKALFEKGEAIDSLKCRRREA
jgi:hypothetical protein